MVKKQLKRTRKALLLKRLSENVPKPKYLKYQEEELKLYESIPELPKLEEIVPKEEIDLAQQLNWEDEHDDNIQIDLSKVARMRKFIRNGNHIISGKEYQRRLRQFYNARQGTFYDWKSKQPIQQEMTAEINYKSTLLEPKRINIEQAGIIKKQIDSVIQSISFHPKLPIFAVGSLDKVLRIYNINPQKEIQLVKTIAIDQFPINKARFVGNNEIIVSSNFKSHLLQINYETQQFTRIRSNLIGKYNKQINFEVNDKYLAIFNDSGSIQIHNLSTKLLSFELHQNESCSAVAFFEDNLISAGKNIYHWNLKERQIVKVYHNPGGFEVNSLDFKMDLLAVGCKTGIVNLFRLQSNELKLLKEVQNLTTAVDQVQFNPFGEFLLFASKWKNNALRILHIDSLTVFENWPNKNVFLKKVTAMGISNDSRFLIIGNEEGDLRAYRLNNY